MGETTLEVSWDSGEVRTYEGVMHEGVLVFCFDTIQVSADFQCTYGYMFDYYYQLQHPLALLSRGDLTLNTSIDLSGVHMFGIGLMDDGGRAGAGGGRGGLGYNDVSPGEAGSDALGLVSAGDGGWSGLGGWGGGGGGAIELGAVGDLTMRSSIVAHGADGQSMYTGTGGSGGEGGGILVHGYSVDLSGSWLAANGGNGGLDINPGWRPEDFGDGGRGGEIYILYGPGGFKGGLMDVAGGVHGFTGEPAPSGTITIVKVPEPAWSRSSWAA